MNYEGNLADVWHDVKSRRSGTHTPGVASTGFALVSLGRLH